MATKRTRLTHKIAIQLHLVADSCTICSSHSRRPVRKLLDTPWYWRKTNNTFICKCLSKTCLLRLYRLRVSPYLGCSFSHCTVIILASFLQNSPIHFLLSAFFSSCPGNLLIRPFFLYVHTAVAFYFPPSVSSVTSIVSLVILVPFYALPVTYWNACVRVCVCARAVPPSSPHLWRP
jgi:hypothetical protein